MERKKASDFPQELWYLVEDFNHGFISRREFFERAGKFAIGGLTVAGLYEAMSYNFAFGQQIPTDGSNPNTQRFLRRKGMERSAVTSPVPPKRPESWPA